MGEADRSGEDADSERSPDQGLQNRTHTNRFRCLQADSGMAVRWAMKTIDIDSDIPSRTHRGFCSVFWALRRSRLAPCSQIPSPGRVGFQTLDYRMMAVLGTAVRFTALPATGATTSCPCPLA